MVLFCDICDHCAVPCISNARIILSVFSYSINMMVENIPNEALNKQLPSVLSNEMSGYKLHWLLGHC